MSLSFPLSLPDADQIRLCEVSPKTAVLYNESPITFGGQTVILTGQRFAISYETIPMVAADARPWRAFFVNLEGKGRTFLGGDLNETAPLGTASTDAGTLLVNGASQTGNTLVCDGAPNNATGYLLAGDYLQLGTGSGTRMYVVQEDANSDGGGGITFTIWPILRTSPGTNDAVTLTNCKTVMKMFSKPRWFKNPGTHMYSLRLDARESL